ncbi:SdpI family protein [Clostridium sporogenes]|nr:SdpI family protein [Clostridium sporogenes]
MKNQDTWDESQRYAGLSMIILGIVQGILGILLIIQPINIDKESIQLLFLLIGVIIMLIIDEKHLRNLFNKDGTRKK